MSVTIPSPPTNSVTGAPVSEVKTQPYGHVPWPVRPSPGINYNFVSAMYLGGSALALMFYSLEKHVLAPLLEEKVIVNESNSTENVAEGEGDSWVEFAKGMEGMHLIFVPFVPCLLWSLVVRYYWMKETKVSPGKKSN
ncbi:hypothetical protein ACHAWF_012597 [Thalassiosira exigua]